MQPNRLSSDSDAFRDPECGQASVLLLLMLSTFLLGLMAFAVDLTGLWFHRQAIQSAADAACLAGASDMLAKQAGVTPPGTGFSAGTEGNCVSSPSAPLCQYAGFNGYKGAGLQNVDGSNTVAWKFPSTVPGVTKPTQLSYPFLSVAITENVKTYFAGFLHGSRYQPVSASSTCAVAYVKEAPPVVVLNQSDPAAFSFTGSPTLNVVGGPSRSLQINSSSTSAVQMVGSGGINLSTGGPKFTGSDVAIYGGPATPTAVGNQNPFNGGTTGHWTGHALPIGDPFGSLAAPASVKTLPPANGLGGKYKAYTTDGCPDHGGCVEMSPGYYPSGINVVGTATLVNGSNYGGSGASTLIFVPGIYYMNGSLNMVGSTTLRMAKPSGYQQTDGVMFYFKSGSLALTGSSGQPNAQVDNVSSTDLTCDGLPPSTALNMPSTIPGNVLWAQCTNDGTYWDAGNDTTDFRGNTGSRGMLIFEDHANTAPLNITGSGDLGFSGTLYLHSTGSQSTVNLTGSGTTGTFILGEIIADKIKLTGSGSVNLALNSAKTISIAKVALVQ